MSRLLIIPLSFIILVLSACAPPPGGPAKKEKASSEKIVFTTAKATVRNVPVSFQATGAFIAEESSDIAPAIGGRVAATPVEVGDYVRKGQAICILEQRDAQLRLDQAQGGQGTGEVPVKPGSIQGRLERRRRFQSRAGSRGGVVPGCL